MFGGQSSSQRLTVEHHSKCASSKSHKKSSTNYHIPDSCPHLFVYDVNFEERRDRQQYFYSRKTANLIIEAILQHFHHDYERIQNEFVCLCVPSIAEILYREYSITVTLLDVDTRFDFLPGFKYFDLLSPSIECPNSFSLVLFDPPYFGLPFSSLSEAVSLVSTPDARLLLNFVKRDERILFNCFPTLRRTTVEVEYDRVKPSRWANYGLYSNCDLKGVRRLHEDRKEKKPENRIKEKQRK